MRTESLQSLKRKDLQKTKDSRRYKGESSSYEIRGICPGSWTKNKEINY